MADTASQESEEDAYKYALRESILSNYTGERLKYFSKLPFEQLEKAHLQYQSSIKPKKTIFNPEEEEEE